MQGTPWQLVVIALVVAVLGLTAASATSTGAYTATDTDTTTIQTNTTYEVTEPADSNLKDYNDTINVSTSGSPLTAGEDYTWNETTGVVTWLDSTSTSEGDPATIEYGYSAYRDSTSTVQRLTASLNPLVWLAFVVVVVGTGWRLAHGGGGGF